MKPIPPQAAIDAVPSARVWAAGDLHAAGTDGDLRTCAEIQLSSPIMALEIERRFRVSSDDWRAGVARSMRITQGYLAITEYSVIRVRVRDAEGYVTIKSRDGGIAREEFEYAIPLDDARALLKLCGQRILEKIRHEVTYAGYCWEIDEYLEPFNDLIIAEVELQSEGEDPPRPAWIGEEITQDGSFSNAALAQRVEAWRRSNTQPANPTTMAPPPAG